jgi:dipeptidase E
VPAIELLLLSSSRTSAGYFTEYLPEIRRFAAGARRAVFLPFAAVSMPWDEYARRVSEALGFPLHPVDGLGEADLVVVGGGNTFQLLRECRTRGLLDLIGKKVRAGQVRYLGWSAGANLACPTIRTTNDMPIVDPGGLDALGLVGFQINPHYVSVSLPGHHGETRDERLAEFARANPALPAIALPEGDWLRMSGGALELGGRHAAVIFAAGRPPQRVEPGNLAGTALVG